MNDYYYTELWTAVNMAAAFRAGERWTLCNASLKERLFTAQVLMREPFTNFWGNDEPPAIERSPIVVIH